MDKLEQFGPFSLVILQGTSFCNLDCDYCYLPDRKSKNTMSLELLEPIFQQIFSSRFLGSRFTVCWHAGEPLALPISFYESALQKIEECSVNYNPKKAKISYSIQTNGTFLNQQWCDLINKYQIRLGLSLDGPAFLHDKHRHTLTGKGTHAGVMRAVELLKENNIDFHVISVITQDSLDYPEELFNFYVENGIKKVGFNVEEVEGIHDNSSMQELGIEAKYIKFISRFWELVKEYKGVLQLREFERICDLIYTNKRIKRNQLCTPFSMLNIDYMGNFSTYSPELLAMKSADYGDFVLGNILEDSFESVCSTEKFHKIWADVDAGVELCRMNCEYFGLCGGGAASNKYWENGTFRSHETTACRYTKKLVTDIILTDLEENLGLKAG